MIKRETYILGLTVLVVVVSSGFIQLEETKVKGFHLEDYEVIKYHVANKYELEDQPEVPIKTVKVAKKVKKARRIKRAKSVPFLGNSFQGFAQKMAFKESRGQIHLVNPYGYMGKYQFGKSALRAVGIYDFQEFLVNEIWQDKAFEALVARNKWELRKEIAQYVGTVINEVEITESGIIAAAHLGGAGSVKKYLRSNGQDGFKDGFGTSIASYMKSFANYDLEPIKANYYAKVKLEE